MVSSEELISRFSIADYVVFSLMLAVSAAIGIYYACSGGKQKTNAEFLMADRSMSVVPVAMSILASFMSAIALLGTPIEVYLNGIEYWLILVAYTVMCAVSAFLFVPIFFNLQLTSVNEYLEVRFNLKVRIFASVLFILQMILYMAIVLYTPSLALSQVTGLSVWGSVLSTGIVCTFYTTIGGLKAVVWTDSFQVCMMFAATFTVCIKGCIDVGGIEQLWKINTEGQRLNFITFDPDPTVRHTIWSLAIGGFFTWIAIYGVNQTMVQRYLSLPTLKKAQLAILINYPMLLVLITITSFGGLVLYAKYHLCDPIYTKRVTANDQTFALFVMETLGEYPGIPGLFVAGVFSGALSTVSSGMNSLAAVTIEDIVKPFVSKTFSETKAAKVTKCLALGYGVLCIALVAVAEQLGGVLQAALAVFGMIGGPLLGLFTLGIFFPFANSLGAGVGAIVSLVISFWIGVGAFMFKPTRLMPPRSVSGCPELFINVSDHLTMSTFLASNRTIDEFLPQTDLSKNDSILWMYKLSYLWLSLIAVMIVLIVGIIVSLISGKQDAKELDPSLICPIFDKICCCFPARWRRILRCHVGENYTFLTENDLQMEPAVDTEDSVLQNDTTEETKM